MPIADEFGPSACVQDGGVVIMSVDEYEIIRLVDFEGLSQDESAQRMGVARSTAQRIYGSARKKLADFLINAKELRIEGVDYRICPYDKRRQCGKKCCRYSSGENSGFGGTDEN